MLRFITLAAPYLLKGAGRGPIKTLIGRSLVNFLVALGCIFLLCALFVFVSAIYTVVAGFLSLAAVMFLGALCLIVTNNRHRKKIVPPSLPESVKDDLLAKYIPESMAQDPVIQKMLKEIGEHPMGATAAAVTLGMLIGHEYFDGE